MKVEASIRRKVMLVVMTTSLLAQLLSATALLVYEITSYRASWVADLETQADLMAQASAPALNFDDARVAGENLALLRLRPQIESAAIYGARGQLFAAYTAPGHAPLPSELAAEWAAGHAGHVLDGDRLDLQQGIEQNGERLGTMVLRARYDVAPRVRGYLAILGAVTAASLALAGLVARRLQRTITDPIVAVAEVAREVVQQRNYALRAPKTSHDEVGALVDAFNDMLVELGAQAAALQTADRRKDEFLATLAHELRNPLAPLTTALAILDRDDAPPAARLRMQAMMQRQLQQMVRLIDDLLEVSRISTGRLRLRMQKLDLVEVLQAAMESIAPALVEREHTVLTLWPPEPIWVHGDRERLTQVFVNLLHNAAKYTDPGGRIEFAVETEQGAACVRVADNGIGIDPSVQRDVFEMFVQVDHSMKRGRTGLGVGLPLARQLVALHGGALELDSAGLGQGSTFTVRLALLPLHLADARAPAAH